MISKKLDRISQKLTQVSVDLQFGKSPEKAAKDLDAITVGLIAEKYRVAALEKVTIPSESQQDQPKENRYGHHHS